MKKTRTYIIVIFQCLLLVTANLKGQLSDLYMVKHKGQSRLLIEIDSCRNEKMYYSIDCSSEPVTRLPDSQKIQLIEKLLGYERNTSLCWAPVRKLHPLSTQLHEPVSKKYRVQIEALVLINLLAFGSDFFSYSPWPVLYFVDSGKELASNQKKINEVYGVYRQWFNDLKLKGFKSFGYPALEKVGMKWFGTGFSKRTYKSWGVWDPQANCVELE